jgi:hypothetical protein
MAGSKQPIGTGALFLWAWQAARRENCLDKRF